MVGSTWALLPGGRRRSSPARHLSRRDGAASRDRGSHPGLAVQLFSGLSMTGRWRRPLGYWPSRRRACGVRRARLAPDPFWVTLEALQ